MAIFLILAPYGAFAVLMLITSATLSLIASSAVCLATIAVDRARGRSLKILPAFSAILFAGIAVYLTTIDPHLSDKAVRDARFFASCVDGVSELVEIEPDRGKLKVTVNIFGRNTPVELEYWQVEKA